jgi:hypothetical protein
VRQSQCLVVTVPVLQVRVVNRDCFGFKIILVFKLFNFKRRMMFMGSVDNSCRHAPRRCANHSAALSIDLIKVKVAGKSLNETSPKLICAANSSTPFSKRTAACVLFNWNASE